VDVAVSDGVVTLSGNTDSWQEKQLAGQVAEGVRGVRSLKNDLLFIPVGDRTDREIANDVQRSLKMDVRLNDARTKVAVVDGKVTLSGYVGSSAEKHLAGQLAWVSGVKSVDSSGLAVDHDKMREQADLRTKDPGYSSEEISSALQAAFKLDPRVKHFNVVATVLDGSATLTGTVDHYAARLAADRDARNTVGVHRVVDLVKVRPKGLPGNTELRERVIAAIHRDPQLQDAGDIYVTVRNGKVILKGDPNNDFDAGEAYRVASRVKGVVSVENRTHPTTVRIPTYGLSRSWTDYVPDFYWPFEKIPESLDSEIKARVKSQLFWSPFVDSDHIKVSVKNGRVTLSGYVDDYGQRRLATKNAWDGGARGVLNHLDVH
jgi:osmotically-inducible protein OsmY